MAAEIMADKLCAIAILELPADMREEAPSLDEVLAYLASIGQLHDEKAAEIAAGIIEYLQSAEYGKYPSADNYPALEAYETMTGAIDALLSSLEREA